MQTLGISGLESTAWSASLSTRKKDSMSRTTNQTLKEMLRKAGQVSVVEKKKTAKSLHRMYNSVLISRQTRFAYNPAPKLVDEPEGVQTAFKKSALACLGIDARPKLFIIAQFEKFDEYGRFKKRTMYPQPQHLHGVQAMARYVDYAAKQEAAKRRQPNKRDQATRDTTYGLEERKLKSLMRVLRVPDTDVLCDRPEEFSRGFLEHRGVWDLVSETYEERTA